MRYKYRNKPVLRDNIRFDSTGEYERWTILQLLERSGHICNLRRQVKFDLGKSLITGRMLSMRWDYSYRDGGNIVVEDWKGMVTKEWAVKAAWFAEKYPLWQIRITGRNKQTIVVDKRKG